MEFTVQNVPLSYTILFSKVVQRYDILPQYIQYVCHNALTQHFNVLHLNV